HPTRVSGVNFHIAYASRIHHRIIQCAERSIGGSSVAFVQADKKAPPRQISRRRRILRENLFKNIMPWPAIGSFVEIDPRGQQPRVIALCWEYKAPIGDLSGSFIIA